MVDAGGADTEGVSTGHTAHDLSLRPSLERPGDQWGVLEDAPLVEQRLTVSDSWARQPPAGKVGFMYMLAGGTDASNTDPYAQKPTATNHWVKTGPHIMVVGADASFYDSYPKGADPDTSVPYVMWAGTP